MKLIQLINEMLIKQLEGSEMQVQETNNVLDSQQSLKLKNEKF